MYRVTVLNNVDRKFLIVDGNTSIGEIMEMADMSGVNGTPVIGGYTITDLDVTLAELGVSENCTLSITKNLNNAQ